MKKTIRKHSKTEHRHKDKHHDRHGHNHRSKQKYPIHNHTHQHTQHKEKHIYKVDRNQVCPFLVKIYYAINDENNFKTVSQLPANKQLKLHLWMDSTLREITQLIRIHLPVARTKQRFTFWKVGQDPLKKQLYKNQMGSILMYKRFQKIQDRTLFDIKFQIGNMIDVAINYK